jgi:flagellar hook-associated protein 3 FlgL
MRVTSAQVYRSQLRHMRRKGVEAADAQEVASSGRRLSSPSKDPVGAARSLRVRGMLGDVGTARSKIETVSRELTMTEGALESMTDVLSNTRSLAIELANPVPDAGDRAAAATAVLGLRDELLALGNTSVAGRRLFAGSQVGQAAFDASGAYQGDTDTVSMGVYSTATVQVTLDGSAVLSGTGGGPDILQSLTDLATALQNNDVAGIRAELDPLSEGIEWITQQRSLIGSRMSLVDSLDNHLGDLEVQLVDEKSTVEDADVVQAYSDLVRTKGAFEAVLQVTAAARTSNVFSLLGL